MDAGYGPGDGGKPVSGGSIWLHRRHEGYGHDHVLTVQPDRITTGRGGTVADQTVPGGVRLPPRLS